jgi:hypothetical protein
VSELELELRELRIEWPETPDLAGRVEQRLAAAPERPRRSWLARPAWQLAVAATALIIAVVMAIPPARAAVLDWLGFSSVRITREEPQPSSFGQALSLGDPVTLDRARRALPVVIPEELGEPDGVYLYDHPATGPRVDFTYRAREGLPASSNTGVGLLITQFRAVASPLIQKSVGTGATVEELEVDGDPAFFISGAPHGFAYYNEERDQSNFEEQRLAGNTLLVDRSDGILLRIEGEISRERAVEIAKSVR